MFKFKGISSDDMQVVIEEEQHFIAKASQKIESISINGRDGELLEFNGYSNVERPIKVQILNINLIDDIFSWLNGTGILEYNNRITTAHFYQSIEPIRSSSIRIADFMFIRSPFWFKKNDEYVIVIDTVKNEGNIYSKPIIRLEKGNEENIEITIAGIRFSYNFNGEDYVEIDCNDMNAYYDSLLRNRHLTIGYEFPCLQPGENEIIIHQGDPIIKIKRKDCWL